MKAIIDNLNKSCKAAIEQAAYQSYTEEWTENFESCKATVSLKNASIDLQATKLGDEILFEVEIDHNSNRDLENIVEEIVNYLDCNCDPENAWDTAYFEDKDCDPGCDPAFPHYGDYESYRYSR